MATFALTTVCKCVFMVCVHVHIQYVSVSISTMQCVCGWSLTGINIIERYTHTQTHTYIQDIYVRDYTNQTIQQEVLKHISLPLCIECIW